MSQLNQRPVHFVMQSQHTSDGDGVKIRVLLVLIINTSHHF